MAKIFLIVNLKTILLFPVSYEIAQFCYQHVPNVKNYPTWGREPSYIIYPPYNYKIRANDKHVGSIRQKVPRSKNYFGKLTVPSARSPTETVLVSPSLASNQHLEDFSVSPTWYRRSTHAAVDGYASPRVLRSFGCSQIYLARHWWMFLLVFLRIVCKDWLGCSDSAPTNRLALPAGLGDESA